jgi:hypothetical protein
MTDAFDLLGQWTPALLIGLVSLAIAVFAVAVLQMEERV